MKHKVKGEAGEGEGGEGKNLLKIRLRIGRK